MKLVLVLCCCSIFMTANAGITKDKIKANSTAISGPFLGFYLGLGLSRFNIDDTNSESFANLGAFSPLVGVDLGYGKLLGKYYLGIQADINNINRYAKSKKNSIYKEGLYVRKDKIRESFTYGVNLQAGYLLTRNNVLYVLFGLRQGEFNFKQEYINYPIYSFAKKYYLTGTQFGIGDLMVLGEHTQLRFYFAMSSYADKSIATANPAGNYTVKYSPFDLNTMLDLDYSF